MGPHRACWVPISRWDRGLLPPDEGLQLGPEHLAACDCAPSGEGLCSCHDGAGATAGACSATPRAGRERAGRPPSIHAWPFGAVEVTSLDSQFSTLHRSPSHVEGNPVLSQDLHPGALSLASPPPAFLLHPKLRALTACWSHDTPWMFSPDTLFPMALVACGRGLPRPPRLRWHPALPSTSLYLLCFLQGSSTA